MSLLLLLGWRLLLGRMLNDILGSDKHAAAAAASSRDSVLLLFRGALAACFKRGACRTAVRTTIKQR
jgi:hypothetical protein